jgi:hypothetical protein
MPNRVFVRQKNKLFVFFPHLLIDKPGIFMYFDDNHYLSQGEAALYLIGLRRLI